MIKHVYSRPYRVNPFAAGTEYIRFQTNFRPINLSRIAKMLYRRCLVNGSFYFEDVHFFINVIIFRHFELGNCVSRIRVKRSFRVTKIAQTSN